MQVSVKGTIGPVHNIVSYPSLFLVLETLRVLIETAVFRKGRLSVRFGHRMMKKQLGSVV